MERGLDGIFKPEIVVFVETNSVRFHKNKKNKRVLVDMLHVRTLFLYVKTMIN